MKLNKNMMIIGGMVLATIIAFLLINFLTGSKGTDARETIGQLTTEIADLESSILDLEVIMLDTDKQLDIKKKLLDEKYVTINKLSDKVDQLEREGKLNKEEISALRKKLRDATNKVTDASQLEEYKKEIDQLVADNSTLTANSDDLKLVMQERDSIVNALFAQIAELEGQIDDCGQQAQASRDIGDANPADTETDPVDTTPAKAPGFYASKFRFYKNNEKKSTRLIDRKNLSQIKVQFEFEGHEVSSGVRNIYVVFKNVLTKKIYKSIDSKSGKFAFNGQQIDYSALAEGNYQGNVLTINRPIIQEADVPIESGAWDTFVYCEGKMIGKSRIVVQQ